MAKLKSTSIAELRKKRESSLPRITKPKGDLPSTFPSATVAKVTSPTKETATQTKARQILFTGLAKALIGLRTSEAARTALRQQGKFQESQTLLQARGFKRQAEDVIERGEESARAVQRDTRTLIGAQRAAQGASGLDIGSGSAAILRLQTKLLGDLDAITIKNNAFRQAFGFKEQALQKETQAQLDRSARKFKERSLRRTGITNLLSEGLSTFQSFKKAGGTFGFGS